MGDRGPAKTPTEILKLVGSRKVSSRRDEAPASTSRPRCPMAFKGETKKFWTWLCDDLEERGMLSSTYGPAMESLCVAWAEVKAIEAVIGSDPEMWIEEMPNGIRVLNPLVKERNSAQERYMRLMKEFGLTAASKANVKGAKQVKGNGGLGSRAQDIG